MITLTDTAKQYLTSVKKENDYVSLTVKSGGCAGFQYIWGYSSQSPIDWSDPIDDLLVVDPMAEMFLVGSTIDYVNELGGAFLAVKNPMSTSSCGCGESFGI